VGRGEEDITEGGESRRGGSIQAMSINDPDRSGMRNSDVWVFSEETEDGVVAQHRFTEDKIEIPKNALKPNLRTFSGISSYDISGRNEYVVQKPFGQLDRFLALAEGESIEDIETGFIEKWGDYIQDRSSHLHLARRLRAPMSAPGTKLLALYSDEERTAPGVMWKVGGFDSDSSKLQCLWFNSTPNMLQILLERQGTWIILHKYILKQMQVPVWEELNDDEQEAVLDVYSEFTEAEFPSLWKQLAMNCSRDQMRTQDIQIIEEAFDGADNLIGDGFEPRKRIDETMLSVLGFQEDEVDDLLEVLYPSVLGEIAVLKNMLDASQ